MTVLTPTLETSRLLLRPLQASDAPRIQALFPHFEILQYMSATIPWPYPDDGADTYLAMILPKIAAGTEYSWAITLKSDLESQLIGVISLSPEGEVNRGFWLAQEYHRQGLMKEAVFAANEFAFNALGMTELKLDNAEPNVGSHRLKEISGAKIVAIVEEEAYVGGRFRGVKWVLTRAEWTANRENFLDSPQAAQGAAQNETKK